MFKRKTRSRRDRSLLQSLANSDKGSGMRTRGLIALFIVLVSLTGIGLLAREVLREWRTTQDKAQTTVSLLSRTLEALSTALLQQSTVTIRGVNAELYAADYGKNLTSPRVESILQSAVRYDQVSDYLFVKTAGELHVTGGHGWSVRHDGMLIKIEELVDAGLPSNGVLAHPVRLPGLDATFIPVMSSIDLPRGETAITGALVNTAKITEPYTRLGATDGHVATLITLDDTILMHLPNEEAFIGRHNTRSLPYRAYAASKGENKRAGLVSGPSIENGMETLFAFTPSEKLPFVAVIGQQQSNILAGWRDRTFSLCVAGGIVLMLLIAFGSHLWRSTRSLADASNFYHGLFNGVSDAVLVLNADGRIVGNNARALKLFDASSETALLGKEPAALIIEDPDNLISADNLRERIKQALTSGEAQMFEIRHACQDGSSYRDCEVGIARYRWGEGFLLLYMLRDISERLHHLREQEYLASHDALTGLPNRYHLIHLIQERIASASSSGFAVMMIDLNRFKDINDTLGHHVGDEVLRTIGKRLAASAEAHGAQVARLGGDELAVISNGTDSQEMLHRAEAILEVIRQPVDISGMALEVGASIGVALYPSDGKDQSSLMRGADIAMYYAKRNALGCSLYAKVSDQSSMDRLTIYTQLAETLRHDSGLFLVYQPKVRINDGKLIGYEALIRWQHPERGVVSPAEFIPIAENSELIHPLTAWVLDKAFSQMAQWIAAGIHIPIAVNVSMNNLQHPDFIGVLSQAIARHEVPPGLVELEITESALMQRQDITLSRLQQIHETGVRLSIDDFGTGYSSLAYLKRMPIQVIKIDQTFVASLQTSVPDSLIVQSTIALAHSFDLEVVAEGVEDETTLAILKDFGCDIAQGYYIGRPMSPAQLKTWSYEPAQEELPV